MTRTAGGMPRPGAPRGLSLGRVLGRTFRLLVRNLAPFGGLGIAAMLPQVLATAEVPQGAGAVVAGAILLPIFLLPPVAVATLTHRAVQQMVGTPVQLLESLSHGVRAMLQGLVAMWMAWFVVASTLGLLVLPLLLTLRWWLAVPVAVMERRWGLAALRRSRELVAGHERVLCQLLALQLVGSLALGAVIGRVLGAPPAAAWLEFLADPWFALPMVCLADAFGASLAAVLYVELVDIRRVEDAAQLAAEFG